MKTRSSIKARMLANEVVERIQKKQKINLQELSVRNGYSVKSAIAQKGVQTKTYQSIVVPVIERMKKLHEKALISLDKRDFDGEDVNAIVNVARQMVHDTQLLSGKSTENIANNIVIFGDDDFLANQLEHSTKKE